MNSRAAASRLRRGVARQLIQYTALAGVLLLALPVAATAQTSAHIVEWDLPMRADASPGAILVDSQGDDINRLFFVTRLGAQRVIRLEPARSLMTGVAQWKSWTLADDSLTTGGTKRLRASRDRRFIFVRTAASIQRVDTLNCDAATPQTCQRIEWLDQVDPQTGQVVSPNVSDLAVNDSNSVFTTAAVGGSLDNSVAPDLTKSYVQLLTPGSVPTNGQTAPATATRWTVGGGAGFCADLGAATTTSFPCLSGIALLDSNSSYPDSRNIVFYSEPEGTDGSGSIGELNISTNNVRRWLLSRLPPDSDGTTVRQPRQLIIDRFDIVWVITGSGHLVSLNPRNNRMTKHAIPLAMLSDPFGVAPDDDVVGYTDSAQNKLGMLFQKGQTFTVVTPTVNTPPAIRGTATFTVMGERATVDSGSVSPNGKVVDAVVTRRVNGDVFVEAQLDSRGNDSTSPLGITPNKGRAQGTFFYAVGSATIHPNADRVGFVRLPPPDRYKHPRDDDDTDDGCCSPTQPVGWHNSDLGDDDDDGQGNDIDTPTANEKATIGDPTPLNPGQSVDYAVTASSTTLALIASATADNPLGQITVEIYDALGVLVAGSLTAPGAATSTLALPAPGSYTVRVKNYGISSINHTPTIVVREPWVP
jgi:hypothetical protein